MYKIKKLELTQNNIRLIMLLISNKSIQFLSKEEIKNYLLQFNLFKNKDSSYIQTKVIQYSKYIENGDVIIL